MSATIYNFTSLRRVEPEKNPLRAACIHAQAAEYQLISLGRMSHAEDYVRDEALKMLRGAIEMIDTLHRYQQPW